MPTDEAPEPDEERILADTAADDAFQADFDTDAPAPYGDANDARQWARQALAILAATLPTDDMCEDQLRAVRDMRIAACERIARVMRLDVEPVSRLS